MGSFAEGFDRAFVPAWNKQFDHTVKMMKERRDKKSAKEIGASMQAKMKVAGGDVTIAQQKLQALLDIDGTPDAPADLPKRIVGAQYALSTASMHFNKKQIDILMEGQGADPGNKSLEALVGQAYANLGAQSQQRSQGLTNMMAARRDLSAQQYQASTLELNESREARSISEGADARALEADRHAESVRLQSGVRGKEKARYEEGQEFARKEFESRNLGKAEELAWSETEERSDAWKLMFHARELGMNSKEARAYAKDNANDDATIDAADTVVHDSLVKRNMERLMGERAAASASSAPTKVTNNKRGKGSKAAKEDDDVSRQTSAAIEEVQALLEEGDFHSENERFEMQERLYALQWQAAQEGGRSKQRSAKKKESARKKRMREARLGGSDVSKPIRGIGPLVGGL